MPVFDSSFHAHAFAGAALDRADALRDDADALARLWPDARVLVLDADGTAFADADGQPFLTSGRELGGGPDLLGLLGGETFTQRLQGMFEVALCGDGMDNGNHTAIINDRRTRSPIMPV